MGSDYLLYRHKCHTYTHLDELRRRQNSCRFWGVPLAGWMFFDWLDSGRGALIDLPSCPRRLLEERKVLYLGRKEL